MRGDDLIHTQLLMAQAFERMAETVGQAIGTVNALTAFVDLPDDPPPPAGMVACISDSNVNTWGSVISGGGSFPVLAFFNGVNWTVIGK